MVVLVDPLEFTSVGKLVRSISKLQSALTPWNNGAIALTLHKPSLTVAAKAYCPSTKVVFGKAGSAVDGGPATIKFDDDVTSSKAEVNL